MVKKLVEKVPGLCDYCGKPFDSYVNNYKTLIEGLVVCTTCKHYYRRNNSLLRKKELLSKQILETVCNDCGVKIKDTPYKKRLLFKGVYRCVNCDNAFVGKYLRSEKKRLEKSIFDKRLKAISKKNFVKNLEV